AMEGKGGNLMEAHVNEECIFCGLCVDLCPEVFQLGEETAYVTVNEIPEDLLECCREAAEECPTEAIELFD
ncbi:MAG TPA: ferredoxin, partial [Bacillota bacterium]|nr:ferredoxin [Bacillota bacterium]